MYFLNNYNISLDNIMNIDTNYDKLKNYYDEVLNKDKKTYKTSNDVPTPIGCIEEMLDKIPKEYWNEKNIKILDPCCGNGNFHVVCHNMIKTYTNRSSKDIIEKSLYFNDINEERIKNVKDVFNNNNKLNIFEMDFLKFNENKRYDLIVANPPYAKLLDNGKRSSKNHNLVRPFLEKSLKILNDNGFLVYIIPNNWMSLADRNKIIKKLTYYQFHWIDIHNAKKWFKRIGSSFTWFVLQKKPYNKPFTVSGIYRKYNYIDKVNSGVRDYIPLLYNKIVQNIFKKTIDSDKYDKFKIETSSDLHKTTKKDLISKNKDEIFKYKLIHTPKQTVYASRPHKYQDGYKLFISTTDKYKIFIDNCGMTQSIAFIRCNNKNEAIEKKNILEHPMYVFINNLCRWGNFNNIRILKRFPIPKNDKDIYKSFNITEEQQLFINKFV